MSKKIKLGKLKRGFFVYPVNGKLYFAETWKDITMYFPIIAGAISYEPEDSIFNRHDEIESLEQSDWETHGITAETVTETDNIINVFEDFDWGTYGVRKGVFLQPCDTENEPRFRLQCFRGVGPDVLAISFGQNHPERKNGDFFVRAVNEKANLETYEKACPELKHSVPIILEEAKSFIAEIDRESIADDLKRCLGLTLEDQDDKKIVFDQPIVY
jgi:hypothetical protein